MLINNLVLSEGRDRFLSSYCAAVAVSGTSIRQTRAESTDHTGWPGPSFELADRLAVLKVADRHGSIGSILSAR